MPLVAERVGQSRLALGALKEQIQDTLKRAENDPLIGSYTSHRVALRVAFEAGVSALSAALDQVPATSTGAYIECRKIDQRRLVLARLWEHYARPFRQVLDEPTVRPTLGAAMELIWSALTQIRKKVADSAQVTLTAPPPMPYIEQRYSPAVYPSDSIPADVTDDGITAELRDLFNRLPVPLLRLPPETVTSPWLLLLIGHEMGHVLQSDPALKAVLYDPFQLLLEQIDMNWAFHHREIFADRVSTALLGEAALWAMAELELGGDDLWTADRNSGGASYPSRADRLALLGLSVTTDAAAARSRVNAVIGDVAGVGAVKSALDGAFGSPRVTATDAALRQDWIVVAGGARHSLGTLTGAPPVGQPVSDWKSALSGGARPVASDGAALALAVALFRAWIGTRERFVEEERAALERTDPGRDAALVLAKDRLKAGLAELSGRVAGEFAACRTPGDRGAGPAGVDMVEIARDLGAALRALPVKEMSGGH